jgi:hypothetical protein
LGALEGCVPAISYPVDGFYCCCLGRLGVSGLVFGVSSVAAILANFYLSVNGAPQLSQITNETSNRQDPALLGRCRVRPHKIGSTLTKRQLVAQILRKYEQRGNAMRCLDNEGKTAWKATPRFLTMLADAEREAEADLQDFL